MKNYNNRMWYTIIGIFIFIVLIFAAVEGIGFTYTTSNQNDSSSWQWLSISFHALLRNIQKPEIPNSVRISFWFIITSFGVLLLGIIVSFIGIFLPKQKDQNYLGFLVCLIEIIGLATSIVALIIYWTSTNDNDGHPNFASAIFQFLIILIGFFIAISANYFTFLQKEKKSTVVGI